MSLTIKNYKKLEGWAHDYKEFMIGEIGETADTYIFRVSYNGLPYTIKIFRQLIGSEYEMILRDGADTTQYGRTYITTRNIWDFNEITKTFEYIIIRFKPKAQQTTGNTNFNVPF